METNRYIVVIGCGRVGSELSNRLSLEGNSVVVIDVNEAAFENLSPGFGGFRVNGDATRVEVLKEAKLHDADILIATSHDDNINLMVVQVARTIFRVPKVMARVWDPRRREVYSRLGIETVCPTSVAADMFFRSVIAESGTGGKVS